MGKFFMSIVVIVGIAFGLHYFNVVYIPWFDFSGGTEVESPESVKKMTSEKDATRKAADAALGDN